MKIFPAIDIKEKKNKETSLKVTTSGVEIKN